MTEAPAVMSGVVIFPKTTEEVVAVVKLANEIKLPLTPWVARRFLPGFLQFHFKP